MDLIFVAKLIPFVIGFVVLIIGTIHSIRKPGENNLTDSLPPNAYSIGCSKDDISV
jgi:hypothetical protein